MKYIDYQKWLLAAQRALQRLRSMKTHGRSYLLNPKFTTPSGNSGVLIARVHPSMIREGQIVITAAFIDWRGDETFPKWKTLPAADLAALLELRRQIDRWINGKLAELPQSTYEEHWDEYDDGRCGACWTHEVGDDDGKDADDENDDEDEEGADHDET